MAKSRRRNRKQRSRKSQRGGGGCAAQYNRSSFDSNQRGGALAEFTTGPALLLDSAGMTHAQTVQQYNDIQSLGSVIPRQTGGQRGGMQGYTDAFSPPLGAGLRQSGASRRNKNRNRRRSRRQRGGMMDYSKAFVTPPVLAGTSFMKMDDAGLGYGFNSMKGAQ